MSFLIEVGARGRSPRKDREGISHLSSRQASNSCDYFKKIMTGRDVLPSKGLSDAQIQLLSGHESKKSLEVYQHLSLETVEQAYQNVMQSVDV